MLTLSLQDIFSQAHNSHRQASSQDIYAVNPAEIPVLNSDALRFQLFKYKYQQGNDFDLYKKADSSEFLQCFLDCLHFCLNPRPDKKDTESSCNSECEVHQSVYISEVLQ